MLVFLLFFYDLLILVFSSSGQSPDEWLGRTENNRVVRFNSGRKQLGQLLTVKVTSVYRNALQGELL